MLQAADSWRAPVNGPKAWMVRRDWWTSPAWKTLKDRQVMAGRWLCMQSTSHTRMRTRVRILRTGEAKSSHMQLRFQHSRDNEMRGGDRRISRNSRPASQVAHVSEGDPASNKMEGEDWQPNCLTAIEGSWHTHTCEHTYTYRKFR